MHPDTGHVPGQRQGLGQCRADQQGADEAGASRVGNPIDRVGRIRLLQDSPDQRQQLADVIPRSELRHHAAIRRMQRNLAVQDVSQQPPLPVVYRDRAFVTGGFDAQHPHGDSRSTMAG